MPLDFCPLIAGGDLEGGRYLPRRDTKRPPAAIYGARGDLVEFRLATGISENLSRGFQNLSANF